MEPNSIEQLIKTTIKDRRIEPSEAARKRLAEALSTKPKKKKKLWVRYGIAASIAFILFLVGDRLFIETVVLEEPLEVTFQKDIPDSKQEGKLDKAITNNQISDEHPTRNQKFNSKSNMPVNKTIVTATHTDKKHLNSEIKKNQFNVLKENSVQQFKRSPILKKDAIQVSDVVISKDSIDKKLELQYPYVTPEVLLAVVEGDSSQLLKPKVTTPTNYVNSDQLLLEMERQLFDEENRGIFKKATKQLKKLKTAVVNRNFKD